MPKNLEPRIQCKKVGRTIGSGIVGERCEIQSRNDGIGNRVVVIDNCRPRLVREKVDVGEIIHVRQSAGNGVRKGRQNGLVGKIRHYVGADDCGIVIGYNRAHQQPGIGRCQCHRVDELGVIQQWRQRQCRQQRGRILVLDWTPISIKRTRVGVGSWQIGVKSRNSLRHLRHRVGRDRQISQIGIGRRQGGRVIGDGLRQEQADGQGGQHRLGLGICYLQQAAQCRIFLINIICREQIAQAAHVVPRQAGVKPARSDCKSAERGHRGRKRLENIHGERNRISDRVNAGAILLNKIGVLGIVDIR